MIENFEYIRRELIAINTHSPSVLVQAKTKKALANLKRAQTLVEKAELTRAWAEKNFWTKGAI